MTIAIIIPAKNEEATLPKLLDSLAIQTTAPDEVIVMNSHSTDRTAALARAYADRLPIQVHDAKIKGVAAARNEGATYASSEILIFIDADASLPNDFVQGIQIAMKQKAFDIGAFRQIMLSDNFGLRFGANRMNDYVRLMSKTPWPIFFSCVLIRRSLFEKIGGFDPEIFIMEDYDLALRGRRGGGTFRYLRHPFFYASGRRYETSGGTKDIFRGFYAEFYRYTHNMRITKPLFEYKMGGQQPKKKK